MTAEKALKIFKNEIYADGKEKAKVNKMIEGALRKPIAKDKCGQKLKKGVELDVC